MVATGDKTVGADVVRSMAERAGATITEVESSHVPMISQPEVVTGVILTALAAVPQKEEEAKTPRKSNSLRSREQVASIHRSA